MISLTNLLKEVKNQPVAIFLAGSPASGKTRFIEKYIKNISNFTILNVDDEYEPLLKKSGLPLDFRKFKDSEDLSNAAKQMGRAQSIFKQKYSDVKTSLQNLIIDGTGSSSREVLKKKQELETLGYKTMMILVLVTPDISLQRNIFRGERGGRTLMPAIILRSWSSLIDNIDTYKEYFGSNFIIYKAYKDEDIVFPNFDPSDPEVKSTFFDPFKIKAKEKSSDERQKSIDKMKDLNSKIKSQMLKINNLSFTDPNIIKSKIEKFVNA
jgi:hypothetical protein